MKFPFNPILAAVVTTGWCCGVHAAVVTGAVGPAPDVRTEVHTVFIENDVAIEHGHGAAEVVIAQNGAGSNSREVKIITSGQHLNLPDLANLPDVNMIISKAMSEAFAAGSTMPMAKNVKNAPYSAEVISEKIQALPDGNQISRKTSSLAYRDSAGRTRQETRDSKGEVRSVHIHDAVEGSRYVLSPAARSATKISIDKDLHKRIEAIKERAKDGKAHIIERTNSGEEIIVKRSESPATDGGKELREEVKVSVVRASGGTGKAGVHAIHFSDRESIGRAIGESMRHGPIGMSFQDTKWSGKSITTQLGAKDFDGLRTEGKSVSYTIPAGEIGNKNPIVVSTETWTSPELQVVVYSRHSDPRVGDSIYRLANVKRTEQPAALFMVPDGYSVRETPGLAIGAKRK